MNGQSYRYRNEEVAPGTCWRPAAPFVPDGWSAWTCVTSKHRYHRTQQAAASCAGIILPRIETIEIIGGDVFLDERLLAEVRCG